jgi:RNase P/RNase MRP subunit POP5
MGISKDHFFRIFQSELRETLQRFFENRRAHITEEIVAEVADPALLSKLMAFELIEHDTEASEYRLDDRLERFLDEMLGAVETAQADWLVSLIEEIRRSIDGYLRRRNRCAIISCGLALGARIRSRKGCELSFVAFTVDGPKVKAFFFPKRL